MWLHQTGLATARVHCSCYCFYFTRSFHNLCDTQYTNTDYIISDSLRLSKRTEKTRRCWTQKEEETLITCLKELVTSGWKADNGFRIGYLNVLEKSHGSQFSWTNLRATPHINLKICVWKKRLRNTILNVSWSYESWNDTTKWLKQLTIFGMQ